MPVTVSSIVEGYGEVEAVPILIRRIALELKLESPIITPRPIRLPRTKIKNQNELSRAVQLAKLNVNGPGGILILMDADEDCPAELGPSLLTTARSVCEGIAVGVVIAKTEFEAWFLAAAESISGKRGLPEALRAPNAPEDITSAKGWLDRQMPRNRKYGETIDQPALTATFDLAAARQAPSFDKCYREVARLLG